jgi:hypothetical protein
VIRWDVDPHPAEAPSSDFPRGARSHDGFSIIVPDYSLSVSFMLSCPGGYLARRVGVKVDDFPRAPFGLGIGGPGRVIEAVNYAILRALFITDHVLRDKVNSRTAIIAVSACDISRTRLEASKLLAESLEDRSHRVGVG